MRNRDIMIKIGKATLVPLPTLQVLGDIFLGFIGVFGTSIFKEISSSP